MTSEAKFPDVVAAVLGAALNEDGPVHADYKLISRAQEALGLEFPPTGVFARQDRDKFAGQVGRALGKLAAEGLLVKIGKGHGNVRYWAPAAWESHQEREAERESVRAALEARKADITQRIRRLDGKAVFYVTTPSTITMTLDTASALLDLAERTGS
jgi:hypothetical protein